ncbi:MAG: AAA family ATPase [Gammaproteobacteria bacterium]|nr:AAA family ATPase [Gammaproteobacteria bacterium]
MRVKEIEVRSLFGRFDHKVRLNLSDRITIVHGPNGVGKTTILRLVSDVFQRRFYSLLTTPFERIVVRFYPSSTLTVKRMLKSGGRPTLLFTYRAGRHTTGYTFPRERLARRVRVPSYSLEREIPQVERISPSVWLDGTTQREMSYDDVVATYYHYLPQDIQELIVGDMPQQLDRVLSNTSIVFIGTDRLAGPDDVDEEVARSNRRGRQVREGAVTKYSRDLVSRIQLLQRQSLETGSSLDSTFPQRLLDGSFQLLEEKTVRDEYTKRSSYMTRLRDAGLISADTVTLPDRGMEEIDRRVLSIYLEDVNAKLSVFATLLPRIELFARILNSRFLYKSFSVRSDVGFLVVSEHDGGAVPLTALSSGEQHQIVLLYELLFRAASGATIFIDEPELSLHITWQWKVLEDLMSISHTSDLDFLIATHSPAITNGRRDLMVNLTD